ncbi:MAG: pentapeptide repeat-containing protein [Hormoscilla sp. GM102CHS1]|nr:pentapeptide repeat-containing protein [Hormoscilla sp. GM102CHS1]
MKKKIIAAATLLTSIALSAPMAAENLVELTQLLGTKTCPGCDLSNAGLYLANLRKADLREADLSGANLDRANLSRANLSGADLSGAVLFDANLSGANLSGANLMGANLSRANLAGANFTGANLAGANLGHAFLGNAILQDAVLEGAILRGTIALPRGILQPEDRYKLAIADVQLGDHRGAIANYEQALELNPEFAPAYLGRGISRLQLGDAPSAIADWQTARELFELQQNTQGYEISQELVAKTEEAIAESRRAAKRQRFMNAIGSIASMLLQFVL